MADICEISDLSKHGCHHCRSGARNLGPAWLDLIDEPLGETGD